MWAWSWSESGRFLGVLGVRGDTLDSFWHTNNTFRDAEDRVCHMGGQVWKEQVGGIVALNGDDFFGIGFEMRAGMSNACVRVRVEGTGKAHRRR